MDSVVDDRIKDKVPSPLIKWVLKAVFSEKIFFIPISCGDVGLLIFNTKKKEKSCLLNVMTKTLV